MSSLNYRLITQNDAELLTEQRNKHRHCFFDSGVVTVQNTLDWINGNIGNPKDLTFIVGENLQLLGPDGSAEITHPVGQFSVHNIILGDRAKCGRLIRYENSTWGFRFSCGDIIHYVSSLYNLSLMVAEVYAWNKSSLMFFAKLGFHVVLVENENTTKSVFTLGKKM